MEKKDKNNNTISELDSSTSEGQGPQEVLPKDEAEDLRQALAAKTEEAQATQDKYLRLAAEFENFKKLSLKEQREHTRFATESILKELLPIVDNLERAIRSAADSPAGNGLIQGVELTLKQFQETLAKFGIKPIASVGQPFDPACHQAVTRVESATAADNTVVEEFQKGYRLHDRVLRAAMVSVATSPAERQGTASAET
ncbi:MAG: nucleotide exchange factor GrpE [Nitrospirota bacterium]